MPKKISIRKIRYSIGIKFGLFVAGILIAAMSVVGMFVVRQQEKTLMDNLRKNMQSYLFSFRKAMSDNLEKGYRSFAENKIDRDVMRTTLLSMQSYTVSLTNIPNCQTAMFVQSAFPGYVYANSAGRIRVSPKPPKLADEKFKRKYKSVDYFLADMVDDVRPYFVKSARFTEEEYQTYLTNYREKMKAYKKKYQEVVQYNKKAKEANRARKKGEPRKQLKRFPYKPRKARNTAFYEGFLPIYLDFYRLAQKGYSRQNYLGRSMGLYRAWNKRGFDYKGVQSSARQKDLLFIQQVERVYRILYQEVKRGDRVVARRMSAYARALLRRKKDKLTAFQIRYIALYRPYLKRYQQGYYAANPWKVFKKQYQQRTAKILDAFYRGKHTAERRIVLAAAKKGELFSKGATKSDLREISSARKYIEIAALYSKSKDKRWQKMFARLGRVAFFPRPFKDREQFFYHIQRFSHLFERYLTTGKLFLPKALKYTRLGRVYKPRQSKQERAEYFKHMFRVLAAPFKVGYVRIILNTKRVEKDLDKVAYRTIDLSASLVLRLIFITFLLSGLMIKNIKVLAQGAAAVGKGDLDTSIDVEASDELGQLADQFNLMIQEIKESQGQLIEKSRMEEELKIAEKIQVSLLPKSFPDIEGFEFAGYYKSQTEAGGDYYDVIDSSYIGKNHFGMVSADVSGHGVGAGLVMSMVRSVLRAQAMGRADAKEVLCRVNPQIYRDTLPSMFATAAYFIVNYEKHVMYYASAGHDPAILYNTNSGELKLLPAEGVPLGMVDASSFNPNIELKKSKLTPGDILILYTDGVTEAMNAEHEEYQDDRLCEAVKKFGSLPLQELLDAIVEDVKKFTNNLPQEDDISLLAMKVL